MRLAEILGPQELSRKKESDGTVAEVFIIESLNLIDEAKNRHEGEVLADILRICGKKPVYYYIRTKAELEMLAQEYEASRYRYLHLSCHGGETEIETTLDSLKYVEFAKIFEGRLRKRRLFASACSAGNALFTEIVAAQNEGMHSVAGPASTMRFDHSVAFWSAFYVKAFSINPKSMTSSQLVEITRPLARLFGVGMHWSCYGKKSKSWSHKLIEG